MTLTQQSAVLYRIRELATNHLERDGHDERQLTEELEAIATIAEGGLECLRDTIELRMAPENVQALEEGRPCHVTFMKLALGADRVYELYLEGTGPPPLPDHSSTPVVPLEGRR